MKNFKKILGAIGMLGLSTPIILSVVACGHSNTSLTKIDQDNFKDIFETLSEKGLFVFKVEKWLASLDSVKDTIKRELKIILNNNNFDLDLDKYTIGWTDFPNLKQIKSDMIWYSGAGTPERNSIVELGKWNDNKIDYKKVADVKIKYDIIIGAGDKKDDNKDNKKIEINQDNFKKEVEKLSEKGLFVFKVEKWLASLDSVKDTIKRKIKIILNNNNFDLDLDKYTIGWTDFPNLNQIKSDMIWYSGTGGPKDGPERNSIVELGKWNDNKIDYKKVADVKIKYDIIIGAGFKKDNK